MSNVGFESLVIAVLGTVFGLALGVFSGGSEIASFIVVASWIGAGIHWKNYNTR